MQRSAALSPIAPALRCREGLVPWVVLQTPPPPIDRAVALGAAPGLAAKYTFRFRTACVLSPRSTHTYAFDSSRSCVRNPLRLRTAYRARRAVRCPLGPRASTAAAMTRPFSAAYARSDGGDRVTNESDRRQALGTSGGIQPSPEDIQPALRPARLGGETLSKCLTPLVRFGELLQVVRCSEQAPEDDVRIAEVRILFVGAPGRELCADDVVHLVVQAGEHAPGAGLRGIERGGLLQIVLCVRQERFALAGSGSLLRSQPQYRSVPRSSRASVFFGAPVRA